tara:strand:- start:321 stop:875 length:555 start_codon:yes stop_codon:yes gene_type:complete
MNELFKDEQIIQHPSDTTVTHVVPSKMEKQIEENKKLFGRRIKQLKVIINDLNYLSTGNEYREFIIDMSSALVHGRKITPKMKLAITNIVKKYTTHLRNKNDPKLKKKKLDYIEESTAKIGMVKRLLKRANYTDTYAARSTYFLNSVEDHLKNTSKLSVKQRKALNTMYKRFEKRVNIGIKNDS